MSYPVGNGTKEDFDKNWKIDQEFGEETGYGYHDGLDINLKTGGDTDMGEKIRAMLKGKLVYYHNESHPTKNFGRHNVYEIETNKGKRWIHQAHCQQMIAQVRDVAEGEEVGKIGRTGTSKAHLHLACLKVDPKTLRSGIDTIPKTKKELNDWWEDPTWLFDYKEETTSDNQEPLKKKITDLEKEVKDKNKQIENYVEQCEGKDKQIEDLEVDLTEEQKARKRDLQEIATRLACTDDLVEVLKEIEKLIVAEEGLAKCLGEKRGCETKYSSKALECRKTYENMEVYSGYHIANPEGVERALKAYAAIHSKQPPSQLDNFSYIIKLLGRTIWLRKK